MIAAIQETKCTSKSKLPPIPNYSYIRRDRGKDKGGGLMFIIHDSIPFKEVTQPNIISTDQHLEELTIAVKNDSKQPDLYIRNFYIPPASSCSQGYSPNLDLLSLNLPKPALILGDINAHHTQIYSQDNDDARGNNIIDWLTNNNYGILNLDTPTRSTKHCNSSPDISLASPSILPCSSWTTVTALSSDHLPIHISLSSEVKLINAPKRTFINFNKANWQGFQDQIENALLTSVLPIDSDPHKKEKHLRKIINAAAKAHIPSGRIPKIQPSIPTQAKKLIKDRDKARSENPSDPIIDILNQEINIQIKNHKKEKWLSHLADCQPGSKQLWSTIKSLEANPPPPPNQSISFNGTVYDNPTKIANKLNAQYTPAAKIKPSKAQRSLLRKIRKIPASSEPEHFFNPS